MLVVDGPCPPSRGPSDVVQIVAMAQRVVLPREETRGRLEDLDSLLQLEVLAAKLPDLPSRLAGHPRRLALVYLGLAARRSGG
jgi:hypothetical protein